MAPLPPSPPSSASPRSLQRSSSGSEWSVVVRRNIKSSLLLLLVFSAVFAFSILYSSSSLTVGTTTSTSEALTQKLPEHVEDQWDEATTGPADNNVAPEQSTPVDISLPSANSSAAAAPSTAREQKAGPSVQLEEKCDISIGKWVRDPNLGGLLQATNTTATTEEMDWLTHTEALRAHLTRAQTRFKRKADKNRTERSFQVGEQVLLKLQPYAQTSVVNRPCVKLAYKFFGPFNVEEKIGVLAYKLALPADSRIHPVFHVSQLKPFTPNYSPVFSELPNPPDLAAVGATPSAILERRMVKRGQDAIVQLKVQWDSLPATTTTWEDYTVLRRRYPQAAIWKGAGSQGGDNVTPDTTPASV